MTPDPKSVAAGRKALRMMANLRAPFVEWLFYLASPDFDREPYLRNNAFAVLVYAMVEASAEQSNRIAGVRRAVERDGSSAGAKLVDLIDFTISAINDLAGIYSSEELIAIQSRRHDLVHGRLHGGGQTALKAFVIKDGKIAVGKVSPAEYYDGSLALYQKYGNPHGFLSAMRWRMTDHRTLAWTLAHVLRWENFLNLTIREVEEDRTDLVRIEWGTQSYQQAQTIYEGRPELFRTLRSYRDEWAGQPALLDQVFEQHYT